MPSMIDSKIIVRILILFSHIYFVVSFFRSLPKDHAYLYHPKFPCDRNRCFHHITASDKGCHVIRDKLFSVHDLNSFTFNKQPRKSRYALQNAASDYSNEPTIYLEIESQSDISNGVENLQTRKKYQQYVPEVVSTLKLPIWPIVGGIITQLADFIPNKLFAEKAWTTIGGRVVPMTLSDHNVSPFLLLAHHTHSFTPLDPFRVATKLIMKEGFPAHPHAGFDTVTYCIEGGFLHRDSEGMKMAYGDGDVQWMRAGRGILHEEMWDLSKDQWKHKHIEIFQLWVNLPEHKKSDPPAVQLLSRNDIKSVPLDNQGSSCKVISGDITVRSEEGNATRIFGPGNVIAATPVNFLHLTIPRPNTKLSIETDSFDKSIAVYVRRGSLVLGHELPGESDTVEVNIGDYVVYNGDDRAQPTDHINGRVSITSGSRGLDCLVLIGDKINEPVVWKGPFVQSSLGKLQEKVNVFNQNDVNFFWKPEISDEEWQEHCRNLQLQKRISASENNQF